MSDTAGFYDIRGKDLLKTRENTYPARRDSLLAYGPIEHLENSLPLATPEDARPVFLDLCCGTGVYSIFPAQSGYQVIGVDISPVSIEAARWLAKENQVSAQFHVDDILHYLNQTDLEFDVIMIAGSLYYLEINQCLPLIKKRLKPGGVFLCLETNGDNFVMNTLRRVKNRLRGHRDERTLERLLRKKDWDRMQSFFGQAELEYFDFLTLSSLLFQFSKPLARGIYKLLRPLDRVLLNRLGLRRFAFKTFFIGRN